MCMPYVSANIALFREIKNEGVISFENPFEKIKADKNAIGGFSIVSYITLMGSKGGKSESILDLNGKLDVCIRLTKCTTVDSEKISYDLDKFQIDTKDKKNTVYRDACVPYLNYKRISDIEKININLEHPEGNYVIKILLKKPDQEKYVVHSMHCLYVE